MSNNRGERMKKMLTFFILWMLVLAGILSMAGCSMRFRKVRIGTAGIGGNYYSFGKTFSEFLMGDISTVDVKVISTAGSAENLKMITGQKPQIDLAIIQADILNEMEEERIHWHSSAVSGRGISTCSLTKNVRPQKSVCPRTYWTGSWFDSRRAISCSSAWSSADNCVSLPA